MTKRDLDDSADYVVVGTGAGGATAARVLSDAGYEVVLLEEGPALDTRLRSKALLDAMDESMHSLATLATRGRTPVPLLLGRCVGGSTAINSGITWRLPRAVSETWAREHGLHEWNDERTFDRIFSQIEKDLGVSEVSPELLGGNGSLLAAASEALGLPGRAMRRNTPTCLGSGRCLQGCPHGARQSMDVSYIPRVLASGGRLHALAHAQRVLFARGRAVGVTADLLDAGSRKRRGRIRVHARRGVIVAASAIHTPVLLMQSGLRRNVGMGYQAHPGVAVVGRFDHAVNMSYGATQAYEVPLFERGVKLESLVLPPELLAARLPGAGECWQRDLAELDHFAQFCAIMRLRARGRVSRGLFGGASVRYELTPEDLRTLGESVVLLVRAMFAAGAREVMPGVAGIPERLTSATEIEPLLTHRFPREAFHILASHHFASAAAGTDPKTSVVGPDLEAHGAKGLYVMDASVLPTNLGVNPQHTIMAVVYRAAERLANSWRPSLRAA